MSHVVGLDKLQLCLIRKTRHLDLLEDYKLFKPVKIQEEILEYKKCLEDPSYFARKYVKIISLDVLSLWYNVKSMIFTKKKNLWSYKLCKKVPSHSLLLLNSSIH